MHSGVLIAVDPKDRHVGQVSEVPRQLCNEMLLLDTTRCISLHFVMRNASPGAVKGFLTMPYLGSGGELAGRAN